MPVPLSLRPLGGPKEVLDSAFDAHWNPLLNRAEVLRAFPEKGSSCSLTRAVSNPFTLFQIPESRFLLRWICLPSPSASVNHEGLCSEYSAWKTFHLEEISIIYGSPGIPREERGSLFEQGFRGGPRKVRGPLAGLWRIALYYVVLFVVTYFMARYFPVFHLVVFGGFELLSQAQPVGSNLLVPDALNTTPFAELSSGSGTEFAMATVIALLGALALMIPVAWVYLLTKQKRGYDESVVQAMLILPIAVAGIVFIVKFSLALAFSLAGIVAAVRFRSTLKDTKDAVYVFLAIGVGLASGAWVLGVAAILSIVFNAVILYLWWSNFGNIYADQRGRTGALGLADVIAGPGSAATAISVGDPQLLEAMTQEEIRDVATRVARMERYLRAEKNRKKKDRLNGILIVHAEQLVGAQVLVDEILAQMARRWELAEILPSSGATSVLEYLVRMKSGESPARLLELLQSAPGKQVLAAEYRSLEGLAIDR